MGKKKDLIESADESFKIDGSRIAIKTLPLNKRKT